MLIETQIPGISDHGLMAGLGDDDHTQYLLADGSRPVDEIQIGDSMELYIYLVGNDPHFYCDAGDIYLDVTSCLYVGGDLYMNGTEFSLGYDGLRIRQNGTTYAAEYDSWDKNEHYFQYQGTNLFAVKSTGIYIYGGGDEANIKMVSNNLEIWGGYGDIVIYPYNLTEIHYLYAPDGIQFDVTGGLSIFDSSGDMCFTSDYGFFFEGNLALRSDGGFMSSAWNPGITQSVDYSDGTMYFEDGLLVYVYVV